MNKINEDKKQKQFITVLKKIITMILYIIIFLIIFYNVVIIIKTIINPNSVPDFFGYKNFTIVSGSMEPTIMTGDAIFVKEVPQNELQKNDIISFRYDNIITTHRIVDITTENGEIKYITKGDHNNSEDEHKVDYGEIEGKFKFKSSGLGKVLKFLQNKVIWIMLVIILLGSYLLNRKNQILP